MKTALRKMFFRCFRKPEVAAVPVLKEVNAERELSMRAFALWERAGHPVDREWDFWNQAEAEFDADARPPCHRTNFQRRHRR